MSEEKEQVTKSWFNRFWSAVLGVVIGIAAMFGVNHVQINSIKEDVKKAYAEVQTTITAIQEKKYFDAIESGKNAITTLQTITGEVKEAIDVAKTGIEEYKADYLELKAAVDAKDWKTATTVVNRLLQKINENAPVESLTGFPKKLYDLLITINKNIEAGAYDPIIETIEQIKALFEKQTTEAEVAPVAE